MTTRFKNEIKLLVVEDNKLIQAAIKGMLNYLGCSYELAENGNQALELLLMNYQQYHMVLLDIGLPDIMGYEVAKRAFASNGFNNLPPIVALTAQVFDDVKDKCLAAGVREFVAKPIGLEQLACLIERNTQTEVCQSDVR